MLFLILISLLYMVIFVLTNFSEMKKFVYEIKMVKKSLK